MAHPTTEGLYGVLAVARVPGSQSEMNPTEDNVLVVSCARAVDYDEQPLIHLTLYPEGSEGEPTTALKFFVCTLYGKEVPLSRQFWEPLRLFLNLLLGREQLLGEMTLKGDATHRALAEFFAERAGHSMEWDKANLEEENEELREVNGILQKALEEIGEKLAEAPWRSLGEGSGKEATE